MKINSTLGVVLAGGKSQRMGVAKSTLLYKGTSLLEYAKTTLQEAGCFPVVVSGVDGIADMPPSQGPIGGIKTILQCYPKQEVFLFIPVDMPFLQTADLKRLLANLCLTSRQHSVHFTGNPLPFALKAKSTQQIANMNTPSIKDFLTLTNAQEIAPPSYALESLNTPEQWEKFLESSS